MLETFYGEKQPLSDDANLERRTAQALRHYREALAMVENLEREEASAHQALIEMLPDFERAILEDRAPSIRQNLFETGLAVVARSDEASYALNEATATLEVARQALTALEQQLGYIPVVPTVGADSKDIVHSLIADSGHIDTLRCVIAGVLAIHALFCGKGRRGWPGRQGVYARLRRAMPAHDGVNGIGKCSNTTES